MGELRNRNAALASAAPPYAGPRADACWLFLGVLAL